MLLQCALMVVVAGGVVVVVVVARRARGNGGGIVSPGGEIAATRQLLARDAWGKFQNKTKSKLCQLTKASSSRKPCDKGSRAPVLKRATGSGSRGVCKTPLSFCLEHYIDACCHPFNRDELNTANGQVVASGCAALTANIHLEHCK